MSREIELKYRFIKPFNIEELISSQLIAPFIVSQKTINMFSIYYDNEDFAIARKHSSLRLRRENDDSIVTLKSARRTNGALADRGEWQVSAKSVIDAIPLLISIGAPSETLNAVVNKKLVELAHISFTRLAVNLKVNSKLTVELAYDVGTFRREGRERAFSELELELITGEVPELISFGESLCARFPLEPEPLSKLSRALKV